MARFPWSSRPEPLRRRAERRRTRLGVEGLEARELLATLLVANSGSDDGGGVYRTIQAAATAAASGDEIRVAAGTYTYDAAADRYKPNGNFTYTRILKASSVLAVVDKILTIRGGFTTANWAVPDPVANHTVLDGQGTYRGIFVQGNTAPTENAGPTGLTLEGVTIQNTVARPLAERGGLDTVYAFGGGLFGDMGARRGDPTPWLVRDVVFRNNRALAAGSLNGAGGRGAGGAVALREVTNATFQNVVFEGNQAIGSDGPTAGGGALGGAIHLDHSVLVGADLTFTGNVARSGGSGGSGRAADGETADGLGGAIAAQIDSRVTLARAVATGNQALGGNGAGVGGSGFGGAFYGEGAGVTLAIADSLIQGNLARGANGVAGGIAGGGAIMTFDSSLTLDRSRVVGNVAQSGGSTTGGASGSGGGGGLFLSAFGPSPTIAVTSSVVADNAIVAGAGSGEAPGGGGGVWFQNVTARLDHVTLDANRIDPRQAVGQAVLLVNDTGRSPAVVTLANSIVSNHGQNVGGALDALAQSRLTLARILSYRNATLASAFSGSRVSGLNTVLAPATNAGSPSLYVAAGAPRFEYNLDRRVANPAIDAAVGGGSTVDLDGNPRVGTPDLGAAEATTPRIEFFGTIRVGKGGRARIVVVRRGDLSESATAQVVVVPGGTAREGVDYQPYLGGALNVSFAPGESRKVVELPTLDDGAGGPDRTVNLALRLAPGSEAAARLGNASATATILNTHNPLPSSGFAVLQARALTAARGARAIALRFNALMRPRLARNLRAYALRKVPGGRAVPRILGVGYRAGTVTLKLSAPLRVGTSAIVVVKARQLRDVAGRPYAGPTTFTVTA